MSKPKSDVKVLKGQDAEDKILEYLNRMNRPYGAIDITANLKGQVQKASAQKILVALAEKGLITQKPYGKTILFCAKQASLETMPTEKIAELEAQYKATDEENKVTAGKIRTLTSELTKIKSTPTDGELQLKVDEALAAVEKARSRLGPLRSGAPIISAEDLERLEKEWLKWRVEWIRRKKVFNEFWSMAADSLTPQEAASLEEDLGIERDSEEHVALEKILAEELKAAQGLKRKRG